MRGGQTRHWVGDPQCPDRLVNVIELEDEVQEFQPNHDAGTRQILSVQVDFPMCFFSVLPRVLCLP